MGYRMRGISQHYLGGFTGAGVDLEQALSLHGPAQPSLKAILSPYDVHVGLLLYSSRNFVCLGHLEQARRRMEQAIEEARGLSHAYTLAYVLALGWIGQSGFRTVKELLRYAEELVSITAEHGFQNFWAAGMMEQGWCLAMLGREAEGLEQLTHGLATLRNMETEAKCEFPHMLAMLAEVHGKAGSPEEGLKRLAEGRRLIETTSEHWVEAELHRIGGTLEEAIGNSAAAETSFQQAIHVARRQNAKLWELRATASLARLWRDQGRRAQARNLLAPVYGWFIEGLDTPDLQDAKALLDALV